jgi:DNA-binding transcriptional LysR family regulator
MEIRQLEAFVTVASEHGFTRAADRLALTQPAVTRQIGALEAELGARLLDRLGRRVELTAAGDALAGYASDILRLVAEARIAVADVRRGASGRLSIGASSTAATYLLPTILDTYRRAHPGVKLSVVTGPSPRVTEMVRAGSVDLGIVMDYTEQDGIDAVGVTEYAICLVVSPSHPLASCPSGRATSLDAVLSEMPLIVMQSGATLRGFVDKLLEQTESPPPISMELDNVESIKKMIEAGLGVSILPEIAVSAEVASGRLATVALSGLPGLRQRIAAIHRKDKYLSTAMTRFLAICTEELTR